MLLATSDSPSPHDVLRFLTVTETPVTGHYFLQIQLVGVGYLRAQAYGSPQNDEPDVAKEKASTYGAEPLICAPPDHRF